MNIVLFHGLGASDKQMNTLKNRLQKEGFNAININYPSTTLTI
jgi:triacylglycerol esterase/lipase EstA (alpha/beta hydrolase family)